MTKLTTKTLRCGTTGEWYTQTVRVELPADPKVAARRAAMEAQFDREAAAEAGAIRQHRFLRPDVQKIGWQGRQGRVAAR